MFKNRNVLIVFAALAAVLLLQESAMADRLADAINQAVETGAMDANAQKGYLASPALPN